MDPVATAPGSVFVLASNEMPCLTRLLADLRDGCVKTRQRQTIEGQPI
jgi:hypothetical protein